METSAIQRMTRQRRVILDALRASTAHPTADDLLLLVRKHLPHVSLGTIYRNLDILARCGMVVKLDNGGGPARYDGNLTWHDHIRCTECGRFDDIEPLLVHLDKEPGLRKTGYCVISYRLHLEGICPHCAKGKLSAPPGVRQQPHSNRSGDSQSGSQRRRKKEHD